MTKPSFLLNYTHATDLEHYPKSFDDAVQQGLAEAVKSLHGISGIEITNWTGDVENNQIVRYKVTMHVAFKVEHDASTP